MDLGGRNFLSTPQFLYRWLPNRRGGVSGFGVPPASMRRAAEDQQGGGRHNWGQGFRLGDQWRVPALGKQQLLGVNWTWNRPLLVQSMLKNWALCSTLGFNWLERMFLVQEQIKNSRRKKCRSCSRLASSVQCDSAIKNKPSLYSIVCHNRIHWLSRSMMWWNKLVVFYLAWCVKSFVDHSKVRI